MNYRATHLVVFFDTGIFPALVHRQLVHGNLCGSMLALVSIIEISDIRGISEDVQGHLISINAPCG